MIRIRSLFGGETLIKRVLDYYDAGIGPAMLTNGVVGTPAPPPPSSPLADRFGANILDRAGSTLDTR